MSGTRGDRRAAASGRIARVAGPIVGVEGLETVQLREVVRVGDEGLLAEVIRLDGPLALLQVFEDTTGLMVGDPAEATGAPLEVELGPGLLGGIFDGVQRPLCDGGGPYLERGRKVPALDRGRRWPFVPAVEAGQRVGPGDLLGEVQETAALAYRVLVPPGCEGEVSEVREGELTVLDPVCLVGGRPVPMLRGWPTRAPLPFARRLDPVSPLVTGQRAIDCLFPLARGGTATMPGGFGTGKTVMQQALARCADVDVIVYVGCGERGNELTDILQEFPRCVDPRTGSALMSRTVLVANTSNMPVAAREASIYTGMTIAESFRDQGYDVCLLADSTSRWGEALREISSVLGEMPGEEGYPAYLGSRLAAFYERAGAVSCLGSPAREGSVSVIGAVSPPGGDLSEPITQDTLRVTGTFWALDTELARRRHFPAIHWTRSYSLYDLERWFAAELGEGWGKDRRWALETLQREAELLELVQLLGVEALTPRERALLLASRALREGFLQQSAFDEVDARCPLAKQRVMLATIRAAHDALVDAVGRGAPIDEVSALAQLGDLARLGRIPDAEVEAGAGAARERLARALDALVEPGDGIGSGSGKEEEG